jgi:hypothetical protein
MCPFKKRLELTGGMKNGIGVSAKSMCKFDANFKFVHFRPHLHICELIYKFASNSHHLQNYRCRKDTCANLMRIYCVFMHSHTLSI